VAILAAVLRRSSGYLIRKTIGKGEVLKHAASRFLVTHFFAPPQRGFKKSVYPSYRESRTTPPAVLHILFKTFAGDQSQPFLSFQMDGGGDPERQQALESYKNKLLESREWEAKLKALRMDIKGLQKSFETTEDNIKALQSVGQIIGEVLKQLDDERCMSKPPFSSDRKFAQFVFAKVDDVWMQSS